MHARFLFGSWGIMIFFKKVFHAEIIHGPVFITFFALLINSYGHLPVMSMPNKQYLLGNFLHVFWPHYALIKVLLPGISGLVKCCQIQLAWLSGSSLLKGRPYLQQRPISLQWMPFSLLIASVRSVISFGQRTNLIDLNAHFKLVQWPWRDSEKSFQPNF